MFEGKYSYLLIDNEYEIIIKCLIDKKNELIKKSKYTDGIDDVLIKILNAKKKKVTIK